MLQKQLNKLAYQSKNQQESFLFLFRSFAILITTAETAHRFLRETSNMTLVSPLTEEEAKANSMTDMPVLRVRQVFLYELIINMCSSRK